MFHVQFSLLLLDLHTDFSGGRYSSQVFPSLEVFSTVYCDPQSQRLWHVNKAEIDVFLEPSSLFHDPAIMGIVAMGKPKKEKDYGFVVHR